MYGLFLFDSGHDRSTSYGLFASVTDLSDNISDNLQLSIRFVNFF